MPKADTIGSIYRQRREELRIPLDVAADATNIRARMLATLESGDFSAYPPHGHAVGMLSSYARYLGLDPHPILERYEVEYADFLASQEMASVAERTKRGVGRFGERVSATDKPVSRDSSHARSQAGSSKHAAHDARIAAKLSDERDAEGDERYRSGSVKVVGTRQPDVRPRSGSRHSAGGTGNTRMGSSARMPRVAQPPAATAPRSHGTASSQAQPAAATGSTGRIPARSRGASAPAGDVPGSPERRQPAGDEGTASRRAARVGEPRPVSSSRRASSTGRFKSTIATDEALDEAQKEALSYFSGPSADEDASSRPRARRDAAQPREGQGEDPRSSLSEKVVASRPRLIALVVVILVVVAIIVAIVLVTTSGSSGSDVIDVTGGAQDTTTTTSDPNSATATVTTTNGNPVTVVVSVAEGGTSLISITYDDDNAYSGTAVGPWEREFLVTESFTATVGTPSAVTITQNGSETAFEEDEDGNGVFTLQVSTVATADADEDTGSKKGKKSKKNS